MPRRHKKNTKQVISGNTNPVLLDDDILESIFQYLPTLKVVNLVNKQFYRVASKMRQRKAWLWIRNENDIDDKPLYTSMLNTKRIIKNFSVGESFKINPIAYYETADDFLNEAWYFNAVKTVVGIKNGENAKRLQLMNVNISLDRLLVLLSSTPNLELLRIFFVNHGEVGKHKFRQESKLNIMRIKDIIIYESGTSMINLMRFLPENSIKSLTIKTDDLEVLSDELKYQKNIVKMNLISESEAPLPVKMFNGLKLTHLIINIRNTKGLEKVIQMQTDLTLLDTTDMVIDDDVFKSISRLPKMKKLNINNNSTECS